MPIGDNQVGHIRSSPYEAARFTQGDEQPKSDSQEQKIKDQATLISDLPSANILATSNPNEENKFFLVKADQLLQVSYVQGNFHGVVFPNYLIADRARHLKTKLLEELGNKAYLKLEKININDECRFIVVNNKTIHTFSIDFISGRPEEWVITIGENPYDIGTGQFNHFLSPTIARALESDDGYSPEANDLIGKLNEQVSPVENLKLQDKICLIADILGDSIGESLKSLFSDDGSINEDAVTKLVEAVRKKKVENKNLVHLAVKDELIVNAVSTLLQKSDANSTSDKKKESLKDALECLCSSLPTDQYIAITKHFNTKNDPNNQQLVSLLRIVNRTEKACKKFIENVSSHGSEQSKLQDAVKKYKQELYLASFEYLKSPGNDSEQTFAENFRKSYSALVKSAELNQESTLGKIARNFARVIGNICTVVFSFSKVNLLNYKLTGEFLLFSKPRSQLKAKELTIALREKALEDLKFKKEPIEVLDETSSSDNEKTQEFPGV